MVPGPVLSFLFVCFVLFLLLFCFVLFYFVIIVHVTMEVTLPGPIAYNFYLRKTLVSLTGVFFPMIKSMVKLCLPEFSDFT